MNYRSVANVLGLLVLLALVIPFVIYAVPAVIGAQYSFVVLSGSMSPAIDPGDVVIVGEVDPATVAEGDVITFVRGDADAPVTHRVIGVEEDGAGLAFETMGDANREADANPVPATNVLGVVVLTIPYIGYVVQAVNTPAGFVLLVVVPLVLFVASELWSLFRAARSDGDHDDPIEGDPGDGESTAADGSNVGDRPVSADGSNVEEGSTAGSAGGSADSGGEITISATDLALSTAILGLVAPYAIYVAFELRTTLSISAAFAATLSALVVGGLWLLARRHEAADGHPGESATVKEKPNTVTDSDAVGDEPVTEPDGADGEPTRADDGAALDDGEIRTDDGAARDGEVADRFEEFEPAVEPTTATDGGEGVDR